MSNHLLHLLQCGKAVCEMSLFQALIGKTSSRARWPPVDNNNDNPLQLNSTFNGIFLVITLNMSCPCSQSTSFWPWRPARPLTVHCFTFAVCGLLFCFWRLRTWLRQTLAPQLLNCSLGIKYRWICMKYIVFYHSWQNFIIISTVEKCPAELSFIFPALRNCMFFLILIY